MKKYYETKNNSDESRALGRKPLIGARLLFIIFNATEFFYCLVQSEDYSSPSLSLPKFFQRFFIQMIANFIILFYYFLFQYYLFSVRKKIRHQNYFSTTLKKKRRGESAYLQLRNTWLYILETNYGDPQVRRIFLNVSLAVMQEFQLNVLT